AGHHSAPRSTWVESGKLTNGVAIPDDEQAVLAAVLLVLGNGPNAGELKDPVLTAERGAPFDYDVRSDPGIFADPHTRANHRIRPNFDTAVKFCAPCYHGRGMNDRLLPHKRSWSSADIAASVNSSSTTTLPATDAAPRILQNEPRRRIVSTAR